MKTLLIAALLLASCGPPDIGVQANDAGPYTLEGTECTSPETEGMCQGKTLYRCIGGKLKGTQCPTSCTMMSTQVTCQ